MDAPNTAKNMEVYQIPSERITSTMFCVRDGSFWIHARNYRHAISADVCFIANNPLYTESTVLHNTTSQAFDSYLDDIIDVEDVNVKPIYTDSYSVQITVKSVEALNPKISLD